MFRVAVLGAALFAGGFDARAYAEDPTAGFIHVRAVAGVSVKVDGKMRGVVENDEGLVIRDVAPGLHAVLAYLTGHEDQAAMIQVEAGAVSVLKLRPFQPVPEHKMLEGKVPEDKVKSGSLWVEAIAVHATIDSKALGWKKIALDGEPFVASNLPAGRHKITFCNPDRCIDYRANVKADDVLALLVDFGESNIQDVSATKKTQWARWRDGCEKSGDRALCPNACSVELALSGNARAPACEVIAGAGGGGAGPVQVSAIVETPCAPLAGDRRGYLTIRTEPYSMLYLGDRKLGETPLSRLELPAGCVELRAVAPGHAEKKFRVEIEPDKVVVYAVHL